MSTGHATDSNITANFFFFPLLYFLFPYPHPCADLLRCQLHVRHLRAAAFIFISSNITTYYYYYTLHECASLLLVRSCSCRTVGWAAWFPNQHKLGRQAHKDEMHRASSVILDLSYLKHLEHGKNWRVLFSFSFPNMEHNCIRWEIAAGRFSSNVCSHKWLQPQM